MKNDNALVVVSMHENSTDIVLADQNCNISFQENYELDISKLDQDSLQWEIGGMIAKTFGLENKQRSSAAIAISFPGIVEPISGKIINCPLNSKLNNHSMTGTLKKNIDCPIGIENIVNNALIGENWQGVAQNIHNAIYVDLKESFSTAILADNKIIYGANFSAGHSFAFEREESQHLGGKDLENVIEQIATYAIFLDTELIIFNALKKSSMNSISALLNAEIKSRSINIKIAEPKFPDNNEVIGALKMALTLSFEQ
ncbi:MAG: hypothetical protein CL779_02940 [Chloroflexi bacterium]|nr:hypothetical protein [Chloroflexota bacterium]|tara:strand:- start:1294 stop:2064 length:771 start_codon:yes stop_codon:yes gene_type:complete